MSPEPDPGPHSSPFQHDLDSAESKVAALFGEVIDALSAANQAVAAGDPAVASELRARQVLIGDTTTHLEQTLQVYLARFAPMARDLRLVLTLLRLAPQLERSVELAGHVAERAGLVGTLPASLQPFLIQMGDTALTMWQQVAIAWASRDESAADRLEQIDDRLDDLTQELGRQAGEEQLPAAVGMQLNLLIRFYERLGDHAVHVADRIRWLRTGG
jgi:phosphate transport system protein